MKIFNNNNNNNIYSNECKITILQRDSQILRVQTLINKYFKNKKERKKMDCFNNRIVQSFIYFPSKITEQVSTFCKEKTRCIWKVLTFSRDFFLFFFPSCRIKQINYLAFIYLLLFLQARKEKENLFDWKETNLRGNLNKTVLTVSKKKTKKIFSINTTYCFVLFVVNMYNR